MRTDPQSMSVVAPMAADLVESAKRLAAFQAVEEHLSQSYEHIGIGSGSTVVHVVDAIFGKGKAFYAHMKFTPTGSQSRQLIKKAGLTLCNLDDRPIVDGRPVLLDVAFDGTDEVDEELNLIKGGGGCLFQEKLVVVAAKKFVAVADSRKRSERLCTNWRTIPIEILPVAAPDVLARLGALGCIDATIRSGLPSKAGECVTDNGMWIVDAAFPPLLLAKDLTSETDGTGENGRWRPDLLAAELLKTPGIAECGLFTGLDGEQVVHFDKQRLAQKPVVVYFGLPNGEVQVHRVR